MHQLFVYGTLMSSEVALKIINRYSNEKAILEGFKRYKIYYKDKELFYPAILPQINSITEGMLFRNLSDEEIVAFDSYEGSEYIRREVNIKVNNKQELAWAYIWRNLPGYELRGEWSLENFMSNNYDDFLKELSLK